MSTSKIIVPRLLQRVPFSKLVVQNGSSIRSATALRTHATNEKFAAKVCVTKTSIS